MNELYGIKKAAEAAAEVAKEIGETKEVGKDGIENLTDLKLNGKEIKPDPIDSTDFPEEIGNASCELFCRDTVTNRLGGAEPYRYY